MVGTDNKYVQYVAYVRNKCDHCHDLKPHQVNQRIKVKKSSIVYKISRKENRFFRFDDDESYRTDLSLKHAQTLNILFQIFQFQSKLQIYIFLSFMFNMKH